MIKIISSKAIGLVISGLTLAASTGGAVKLSHDVDSYKPTVPEVKSFTKDNAELSTTNEVHTDTKIAPRFVPTVSGNVNLVTKVETKEKTEAKSKSGSTSSSVAATSDTASAKSDDDKDWEKNKAELETQWESAKQDNHDQEKHEDDVKVETEVETSL
jgi:hypothetical protein